MLLGTPTRPTKFWKHMNDSTAAKRQVYIYSINDELTDPIKLQELYRRKKDIDARSIEFTDTYHVQHFRSHPNEYVEILDNFLASIEKDD